MCAKLARNSSPGTRSASLGNFASRIDKIRCDNGDAGVPFEECLRWFRAIDPSTLYLRISFLNVLPYALRIRFFYRVLNGQLLFCSPVYFFTRQCLAYLSTCRMTHALILSIYYKKYTCTLLIVSGKLQLNKDTIRYLLYLIILFNYIFNYEGKYSYCWLKIFFNL